MTYNDGRLKSVPSDLSDVVDPNLHVHNSIRHPNVVILTILGPRLSTKGHVRVDRWQLLQALGLNITPPEPATTLGTGGIQKILSEHQYRSVIFDDGPPQCRCGEKFDDPYISPRPAHSRHLAEKITEALS